MKDEICQYCGSTLRVRADAVITCKKCIYDAEELDCGCDHPEFVAYKCGRCKQITTACVSMEKEV